MGLWGIRSPTLRPHTLQLEIIKLADTFDELYIDHIQLMRDIHVDALTLLAATFTLPVKSSKRAPLPQNGVRSEQSTHFWNKFRDSMLAFYLH